jgi:EAL domain-containing protein (putative c-di-GMP-specific phosphodiesterase class I)
VADWSFVNQQFEAFRQAGIKIAMDDFGTGYSSLASFKNLCCDIVKIDRKFVKKILENDFDKKLVEYVNNGWKTTYTTEDVVGVEIDTTFIFVHFNKEDYTKDAYPVSIEIIFK